MPSYVMDSNFTICARLFITSLIVEEVYFINVIKGKIKALFETLKKKAFIKSFHKITDIHNR